MNDNLCMRCMTPLSGSRCPACGWHDDAVYDIQYIQPGTVLAGRYLVGLFVRKNGEGALYAGFDNAMQQKVWIREYFPVTIAQRALDTGKISPLAGCGAQYKALMSDFVDICNEVKRLGVTEPVVPIENVFSENNTVYAIYRGLDLLPLEDYLRREGNTLTEDRALALLLPICNTLGLLHSHGQIHRGISTYSIYMDEYDNPYLWDFALSATRTSGSELDAELFSGYTAPEQYSPNGWQGSWTDVYAIGAVFYRILTGIVPPKAIRIGQDRIRSVAEMRPGVPGYLSDTITEAMAISTDERIQTIQTFVSRIVDEEEFSNTAVYDVSRVVREAATQERPRRKKKSGDFKYVMMALSAMLILLAGVMFFVLDRLIPDVDGAVSGSQEEESSEEDFGLVKGTVPSVVGRSFEDLVRDPAYQELFTFSKREDYNDRVEGGIVYDQAPAEGTPIMGHATVIVYVSKGNTKAKVPDIIGRKQEEAVQILREVDILSYELIPKWDATATGGTVLSVDPGVGVEIDPKKDTVRVFVAMEIAVSEGTQGPNMDDDEVRWNNPDIELPDRGTNLW